MREKGELKKHRGLGEGGGAGTLGGVLYIWDVSSSTWEQARLNK